MSFNPMSAREIVAEEAARPAKGGLVVYLGSCGNPDHGQDPTRPMWGAEKNQLLPATSLADAATRCREFIDNSDLGGGNWIGGYVFNATTGESVAYISYNGRIWDRQIMSPEELAKAIREKSYTGEGMMLQDVLRLGKRQAPAVLQFVSQLIDAAKAINSAEGKTAPARRGPKG